MRSRTGRVALVDTGFWIALFEPRDQHHAHAQQFEELLLGFRSVLCPWPILYETLNTRFTRRRGWIPRFDILLKRPNVRRLDDSPYRDAALTMTCNNGGPSCSLVDRVLQFVLEDRNQQVECLFTYNRMDFEGVCRRHRVSLHTEWRIWE